MKGIMVFVDGEYVGKVKEFETREKFVEYVNAEYDAGIEVEQVEVVHVRFVPKVPLWLDCDTDGAYIVCEPSRGSFACFYAE